jgi:sulfate permease, SulP family
MNSLVPAAHNDHGLVRLLPMLGWLRRYERSHLSADVLAGFVTSLLLLPQGVAFALLAGLPPQAGLYASIAGPLLYGLFGTSRTLSVGPVSVAAVMVASALGTPGLQGEVLQNALLLSFECGILFFALAALRLGWLTNLLSHPVLSGFSAGAAVLIIFSQLPQLAGYRGPPNIHGWRSYQEIIGGLIHFSALTLMLGAGAVLSLVLLGRPLVRWLGRRAVPSMIVTVLTKSAPLVVIAGASLIVGATDLADHVALVGAIPSGLPLPSSAFLSSPDWLSLLPSALAISLVGYVESIAIAKALASRRREIIEPNQELLALGAANLGGAFFGAMPVAGGFSRTMVNYAAGARTQLASIITVALVALALLLFSHWFAAIPRAALAALIVVAVAPLLNWRDFLGVWRYDRGDGAVFALTALAVLATGIEAGILAGMALSLLLFIWRAAHPHIAEVGRVPGTQQYRNVRRHAVETWRGLRIFRVDESLSFVNAGIIRDRLVGAVVRGDDVKHLVLLCTAINHVDSSALEMLENLAQDLRDAGAIFHLAEIKGPVMDRLMAAGLLGRLDPGKVFFRIDDAVAELDGGSGLGNQTPGPGSQRRPEKN